MREAEAELICTARRIITMTDELLEAFACRGEWVVGTGSLDELRERFPAARVHDFEDACVIPGFNDAHQHPTVCAEQALQVDLSPARVPDTATLVAALRTHAALVPAGQWIVGFGYDPFRSNAGRDLTRDELDTACPQNPVLVVHVTLHAGVVNSLGLQLAGWHQAADAPSGGELGEEASGRLNGVAHDQALYDLAFPAFTRAATLVPSASTDDLADAFCDYIDRLHAAGITSVTDALVGPDGWRLMRSVADAGRLTVRVNALAAYDHLDLFTPLGQGGTDPLARLRLGGVKSFADGAVNDGTCLLEEPAIGATGHGLARMPKADLAQVIRTIHSAGWRACIHANGDRAIAWTLDGIEQARADDPRPAPRHRIEHASVVTPRLLDRMHELDVVAVPFAGYVRAHGDKLRGFYGSERTERMFAHRSMLDHEVAVAGSSDYPCGPYEPLFGMASCVTRTDPTGADFGASQRITAREALGLFTTGAAFASEEETYKGRIAAGQLADFTVLGADPLAVDPEEIAAIPVRETWVGAARVWGETA